MSEYILMELKHNETKDNSRKTASSVLMSELSQKMIQVRGYAAQQAKAPLTSCSFERRGLLNHDILIDIKFCGICHSDIHQVNNEWSISTFPLVPGHEITGIVTGVGAKATRYKLGDRVGIGCIVDSCRDCGPCRGGA